MAIVLPHIEDSSLTQYIPPKGDYTTFRDEAHYEEMVREWGLSSTKQIKKEFWYKGKDYQRIVTIVGYETYGVTGVFYTLIIRFQDGNLCCINPDYLKDMQSSNFGKESNAKESQEGTDAPVTLKTTKPTTTTKTDAKTDVKTDEPKEKTPKKKAVAPKLELPLDKVHFTAKVKQFSLSWNHFNEENDEVVILEDVKIEGDEPLEVGIAWCSHSKTLKKAELQVGDNLSFDGKIVKKSLPKGKDVEDEAFIFNDKALYKVNNPSKLKKQ